MGLSRKKLVVSEDDGFMSGYLIKQLLWDGVPVIRPVDGKPRRVGLQWLYRLGKEPKRFWRRYLLNNLKFAWLTLLQFAGLKRFRLP